MCGGASLLYDGVPSRTPAKEGRKGEGRKKAQAEKAQASGQAQAGAASALLSGIKGVELEGHSRLALVVAVVGDEARLTAILCGHGD